MLALTEQERAQVCAILCRYLPAGTRVGVFGSRAGGRPKPWSDLDLVVAAQNPLPIAVLAELADAFDESGLPWKVDLVDRSGLAPAFGAIIDASRIDLDWEA